MANRQYMELNKITLARWMDQALKQALIKRSIESRFRATSIWPLENAMNNKFQPSRLYTTRPSNEADETENTLDEQDDQGQGKYNEGEYTQNDQGQGEQDEGEDAQNDQGQGEQDEGEHAQNDQGQGEHEPQYEEEVVATNFINIHISVHQLGPTCYNINLNIA